MQIIIESKYNNGDTVYLEAFGINTYREEKVLEVAATRDNKSFIYKIPSSPPSFKNDTYNWIPEKNLFKSLYELKQMWLEELNSPTRY